MNEIEGIYIAGSSQELVRAERAMALVLESGFGNVYDWPSVVRAAVLAERSDYDLGDEEAGRQAQLCLEAVAAADLVWGLLPQTHSRGFWLEIGYAIGQGIPVILSGDVRQSIFARGPGLHATFTTDDGAAAYLDEVAHRLGHR